MNKPMMIALAILSLQLGCSKSSSNKDASASDATQGDVSTTSDIGTISVESLKNTAYRFSTLNPVHPCREQCTDEDVKAKVANCEAVGDCKIGASTFLRGLWKGDVKWCAETDCSELLILLNIAAVNGNALTLNAGAGLITKGTDNQGKPIRCVMGTDTLSDMLYSTEDITVSVPAPGDTKVACDNTTNPCANGFTCQVSGKCEQVISIIPATVETTLTGNTITSNTESTLFFPVASLDLVIPIKRLNAEVSFRDSSDTRNSLCQSQGSPTPGKLAEGKLTGVITVIDAKELILVEFFNDIIPLKTLLDSFRDCPDFVLSTGTRLESYVPGKTSCTIDGDCAKFANCKSQQHGCACNASKICVSNIDVGKPGSTEIYESCDEAPQGKVGDAYWFEGYFNARQISNFKAVQIPTSDTTTPTDVTSDVTVVPDTAGSD